MPKDEATLPPAAVAAMIAHMNEDHADAVLGYVHRYAALPAARAATLMSLDANGMQIQTTHDDALQLITVPFDHVLRDADDARDTLIAMAQPPTT